MYLWWILIIKKCFIGRVLSIKQAFIGRLIARLLAANLRLLAAHSGTPFIRLAHRVGCNRETTRAIFSDPPTG